MPPPERKLITFPEWEKAKKALENPDLKTPLSFSPGFFHQAYKNYIIDHRHDNAQLQEEYDQQYGLVVKQ